MNYIPDPNAIELLDVYYELCRIEFIGTVAAISTAFMTGILIWSLVIRAKNEKTIW
jgi:hypothetical protein